VFIVRTVLATALALTALLGASGCTKSNPITAPFVDDFNRAELGPNYKNTGGPYRIVDGKLNVRGAYNKPLWLTKQLPPDAEIELDAMSKSPDGDIKIELWGDGESFATDKGAYLASSYVFVLGGWKNSVSVLARMDEHGSDRKTSRAIKVTPGKTYHFKIRRKGGQISWSIDGKPFLQLDDDAPLSGPQHAHFGFNNWQADLYFDNLRIKPL
jgi:hypothetical protein